MKFLCHIEHKLRLIARFLYYFRMGKEFGYPTCCIVHFSWDATNQRPPAILRGAIRINDKRLYVPCGWHMGRHPKWEAWGDRPTDQLRLFKESPVEAQDRRRRERELARRYSGRRFGRPYRVR